MRKLTLLLMALAMCFSFALAEDEEDISMEEILSSPRARALYDGFSRRDAVEPLCRRCGYARRFE